MREDHLQFGVALQHAAEEEARAGERRLGRVADQVLQVIVAHPPRPRDIVGVDEYRQARHLDRGPERFQLGRVELDAVDVGGDFDAPQTEVAHGPLQFG